MCIGEMLQWKDTQRKAVQEKMNSRSESAQWKKEDFDDIMVSLGWEMHLQAAALEPVGRRQKG